MRLITNYELRIKNFRSRILALLIINCSFLIGLHAQSGSTFQIEKSSVAAGGGTASSGRFSLDSTVGQTLSGGQPQAGRYSIQNGFWTFSFAPTAASVSIGGRVVTSGGQGIRNIIVMLTSQNGVTQSSPTGSFGCYRFNDIRVGETYVLTVFSKRFVFDNPTQIVNVSEEITDLDFVAAEQ